MKKLSTDLQEDLLCGEMHFQEDNNRTRIAHWTTEELSMSSLRKNLKEAGLLKHETELKAMERSGDLKICLDDGWLHLTLSNDLLDSDLISDIDWD